MERTLFGYPLQEDVTQPINKIVVHPDVLHNILVALRILSVRVELTEKSATEI